MKVLVRKTSLQVRNYVVLKLQNFIWLLKYFANKLSKEFKWGNNYNNIKIIEYEEVLKDDK